MTITGVTALWLLEEFHLKTGELPVRRAGLRYRVPSHRDPYVDVVSRDPVLKSILSLKK